MTDWPRYTEVGDNGGGLDNHFQGFQRLHRPGYAVISGGDPHTPMSHVFLVKMGSRGVAPVWGSNLLDGPTPPENDRFVARIDVNGTLWHAGGMALLGDILAVPVENSDGDGSRVEFLNLIDPEAPTYLGSGIGRPGVKGGAVALTRLQDGRFLAAVWSDSERVEPSRHFDLYVSAEPSLFETTWNGPFCYTDVARDIPSFQTISFLWDIGGNGDRTDLYLAGFENTSPRAPDPNGTHHGILYRVSLPGEITGESDDSFDLRVVQEPKVFRCDDGFADMDAAAGTYVGPDGALAVYCAHHFLRDAKRRRFTMRFQEFFSTGATVDSPVVALEESRVELFDQPNHQGEPLTLVGARQARVPDLGAVLVRGRPFSRRISSLRCRVPAGFALVLYRKAQCHGSRPLAIPGKGETFEIGDLGDLGFSDVARSCDIVAARVARRMEDAQWVAT